MKRWLFVAAVVTVSLLVAACGGGGGGNSAPGTPTRSFEDVRGELVDRLDTIRVNIASVPADVQTRIKTTCRELQPSIGKDKTTEICGTLDEALLRADPGRIDRVLADLAQLRP